MIVTRFKGHSKNNLFKCVDFFLRYTEQKQIRGSDPSADDVVRLKRLFNRDLYSRKLGQEISLETLAEIEKQFSIRVCIWVKKTQRDRLRIAYETGVCYLDKYFTSTLDLYSTTFDAYRNPDLTNLAVIVDIAKFVKKHNYDPANNVQPWRKMTLFQAVVSELYPKLVGDDFYKKVRLLEDVWGKPDFELAEIKRFYKLFGLGIQFWTRKKVGKCVETERVFDSYWKKKVVLMLDDFDEHGVIFTNWTLTYVIDISYTNFHGCPNKYCLFGTNNVHKLKAHTNFCRNETLVSYKQVKYEKPDDKLRLELVEEKILPTADYHNMFFAVFDVESLMVGPSSWDITGLLSVHKLATIAIVSNFGDEREHFFYRRDMGPEGLKLLIEEFVQTLVKLRLAMLKLIPTSITAGLEGLYHLIKTPDFKKLPPTKKGDVFKKIKILKDIISLRNYSWNGESLG